jgi:hypothetical protein
LLYYTKEDGKHKLVKLLNNLVTALAFNNIQENYVQKNDILPLYILYSQDSFNEIGDPKVMQSGGADMNTFWEDTFYSLYKAKEDDNEVQIEDALRDKYKEPRFDEELMNFEKRSVNLNNVDIVTKSKKTRKVNKN